MNRLSAPPGVHGFGVIVAWRELAKRYARDKDAIEATWRAMGPKARESMLLEAVLGGELPRHANDRPSYFNSFLTPEMNVKNLVAGDNLLDMMAMRATTPIQEAYMADIDLVRDAAQKSNFKLANPGNGVYQFMDEDNWAQLFEIAPHAPRSVRQNLLDMGKGYAMVTEADGRLVLERQIKIYPYLQILADDIMEHKRDLENPGSGPTKRKAADKAKVVESLQSLDLDKKVATRKEKHKHETKITVPDLRSIANEQYETIGDHLHLLRDEPQYLSNIAGQHYFYSTPDVVIPDEHGRPDAEQMMTGAYCNRVIKEAFGDAFEGYGNWKGITALLSALEDKPARDSPVTKELWSLCSRELTRTRLIFKRMLQADNKLRSTYFIRRGTSVQFKAPLVFKGKKERHLELLIGIARADYLDPDLLIAEALKEIHKLEEDVPKFRDNISDQVGAALGDVAVITTLMVKLRSLVVIPKQPTVVFVKSLQERIGRIKEAWKCVERDELASPVSKLKDPGMAEAYYAVLEEECFNHLNLRLDKPFDDCIETALARTIESMEAMEFENLHRRCQIPWDPFINPVGENELPPDTPSEKHEKIKTRGKPAAEYLVKQTQQTSEHAKVISNEKIPVSANAAKTLKKLFTASQFSSAVPWAAFLAAMTNMGFSTEPLWGSVVRFKKSESEIINIHRPHPSDRFEGFAALRLRARLTKRFGWRADSFVVEKK